MNNLIEPTPILTTMKDFNLNKKLFPLGTSAKVFLNHKPKLIESPFRKGIPEFGDFFYVGDQPLMRLGGMIYWFAIGDQQFDIRDMRKAAKFSKQVYAVDKKFENPFSGLRFIAIQLEQVAQKQDLDLLLTPLLIPICELVADYDPPST